MVYNLFR